MDPRAGRRFCGGPGAFFALAADRLKRWIRHQIRMAEDLGGGVSRRAAMDQVQRMTGGTGQGAEPPPEPPFCLRHVGDWWRELLPGLGRREQQETRSPVQLATEIEMKFGVRPNMFEINLLQDLLEIYLDKIIGGSGEGQ